MVDYYENHRWAGEQKTQRRVFYCLLQPQHVDTFEGVPKLAELQSI